MPSPRRPRPRTGRMRRPWPYRRASERTIRPPRRPEPKKDFPLLEENYSF